MTSWTWITPKWTELLPLSLRLSETVPIEVSNLESFSHGFTDLLPHYARIASLTLAFSAATRVYCSQILVSRLHFIPNLRQLSIIAEPGFTPYWLPILSGGMPHLESITLPFFSYGEQVVQLTHLTTINITVEYSALTDVVGLFANNPKLRSAALCGTFRDTSSQRQRGAARMISLRQSDLLSWSATSLLPFLTLEKDAHIRVFGPASILEIIGAGDLLPSDKMFLPNLVDPQKLHWYLMARDMLMEFTGPNGDFSILLPRLEVHIFAIDSFPLGEVEELYCESSDAPDLMVGTSGLNRIVTNVIPAMSQLRKVSFAMCTNP